MTFLFASDSLKGTISSRESAAMLARAAQAVFGDGVRCQTITMADGGEGTADACLEAVGGQRVALSVHGPLMEPVNAFYALLSDGSAVMEMAAASGLPLVPADRRNPLNTTTYGTGEMIRHALDNGVRRISMAIGGSATNDGGMGCMRALGVCFLDADGCELAGCGADLERVERIDCSGIDPRLADTTFTVMCDVRNPLCGPEGATRTFGPQKGATPELVERLEAGMCRYRDLLTRLFGVNPDTLVGAGAAGGLGAALALFLGAKMRSGIETVLDLTHFDEHLDGVDWVITGEGRADYQSCLGKVMQGVGEHCARHGVPVAGLVGCIGEGAEELYHHGITLLLSASEGIDDSCEAVRRAKELYFSAALRLFLRLRNQHSV